MDIESIDYWKRPEEGKRKLSTLVQRVLAKDGAKNYAACIREV